MTDKMRTEFENVFNPPEWSGFDGASNDYFLLWSDLDWRDVDEELTRYNRDWQVWKASRAAINVKLPIAAVVFGESTFRAESVLKSLDAAGVIYD